MNRGTKDLNRLLGLMDAAIKFAWKGFAVVLFIMLQCVPSANFWPTSAWWWFYGIEAVVLFIIWQILLYLNRDRSMVEITNERLKAEAAYRANPDNAAWVACDDMLDKWEKRGRYRD